MSDISSLPDEEILALLHCGSLKHHSLEHHLEPCRAVRLRRLFLLPEHSVRSRVPWEEYPHYDIATKSCCEGVIGFLPLPLGLAGPLLINGREFSVPIATTEGALVASLSRGCRAVAQSGGIQSTCSYFGMTRAPLLKLPCVRSCKAAADWFTDPGHVIEVTRKFESTSNHAKLKSITPKQAGRLLFIRVVATTGEAMGMNVISKGCEKIIEHLKTVGVFKDMTVLSLSGNYCVDKKASAMNWINHRGYSVNCEVTLAAEVISSILKTSAEALAELNFSKNHVGSNLAGCIGGNNAHAANIVSGIFLATGQDAAQAGTSSMAMVISELIGDGDLYVSVTMPCIEVGTVGGGTSLPPQRNNLRLMSSEHEISPEQLAQVVCGSVLAGELSLLAALCSGDLVKSHMLLNRIT